MKTSLLFLAIFFLMSSFLFSQKIQVIIAPTRLVESSKIFSSNNIYRSAYDNTIYKYDKYKQYAPTLQEIELDYWYAKQQRLKENKDKAIAFYPDNYTKNYKLSPEKKRIVLGILFYTTNNKKHYILDTNFDNNFDNDRHYTIAASDTVNEKLNFTVPLQYDYYYDNKLHRVSETLIIIPGPVKSMKVTGVPMKKFIGYYSFPRNYKFTVDNMEFILANDLPPIHVLNKRDYLISYNRLKIKNTTDFLRQGSEFAYNGYTYSIDYVDERIKFVRVIKKKSLVYEIGKIAGQYLDSTLAKRIRQQTNSDGRYLLLDFWASWCGPCLDAGAGIQELIKEFGNNKLTVIGINTEAPNDSLLVQKCILQNNITWNVYTLHKGGMEIVRYFTIASLPNLMVIDPNNKIIFRNKNGKDLKMIKDYLNNN